MSAFLAKSTVLFASFISKVAAMMFAIGNVSDLSVPFIATTSFNCLPPDETNAPEISCLKSYWELIAL